MLIFPFLLCVALLFIQGSILPQLGIFAFSPFLALLILRSDLIKTLWLSCLTGALFDLFSSDPMGLHALNYTIICYFGHRIKSFFSEDEPLHLSVLSALISAHSTLLQLIFLFLFDRRVPFDGRWFLTDYIGMSLVDGLYAFVWIYTPFTLAKYLKRIWIRFWAHRKKISLNSH